MWWSVLGFLGVCMSFLIAAQPSAEAAEKHQDGWHAEWVVQPSTQGLYDACVKAVALADKGDLTGFMRSTCGVFMQGMVAGEGVYRARLPANKADSVPLENMALCDPGKMAAAKTKEDAFVLTHVEYARKFVFYYYKRNLDPRFLALNGQPSQIAYREKLSNLPAGVGIASGLIGEMIYGNCQ